MFYLRFHTQDGGLKTVTLGKDYTYFPKEKMVIKEGDDPAVNHYVASKEELDEIRGFIESKNGELYPIYKDYEYFVMTEAGGTFTKY